MTHRALLGPSELVRGSDSDLRVASIFSFPRLRNICTGEKVAYYFRVLLYTFYYFLTLVRDKEKLRRKKI